MTLQRSGVGWKHVAGLGVSLVIAGQFTGWNYGLASGWANMAIATLLVALLSFGLALCVAELAAARPHAGGLYTYCQDAFGRFTGYMVGMTVFGALAIGTGAAATFISAYCEHVLGFGGFPLKLALIAVIIGVHLRGVGEAMNLLVAAGVISVLAIILVLATLAPHFSPANLLTPELPLEISPLGVFSAIPFAIWLFITVEQTTAASEEVDDPGKNIPRGMIAAVMILLVSALCILLFAVGAGGITHLAAADDPLYAALTSPLLSKSYATVATIVGLGGMFGLLATMFSLAYSASRQLYALAREGHLPKVISRVNRLGAPDLTLMLVGGIAVFASLAPPMSILLAVVLSLSASYIVVLAAFIRLRTVEPDMPRPFRAWGGRGTAAACLVLSVLVFAACFQLDIAMLAGVGAYFIFAIAARLFSRRTEAAPAAAVKETPANV
ncbi:MAG: amino acid permease [Alphaproteobacteria bacterium RIFCSPHIGHO2_12_FULL_63_12]|nr:MAG: amino acid permease [Alphaproteobacteria bacterium RIFCSPHIGHO2_12_FULL_63_12]